MTPDDFIVLYETALASQRWNSVEPLIHEDACVTFSSGTVHKGKAAVRVAFEGNFSTIEDESYSISNVHWIMRHPDIAVYLFDFQWAGRIRGRSTYGAGRGTSLLIRDGDYWKLLVEHLGPMSS